MAITSVGNGTSTSGTTSMNVNYPSITYQAGDKIILWVASKDSATPNTPTGFSLLGSALSSNGEAYGAGTGNPRITVFERTATGSESGSVSVSIGGDGNCLAGCMSVFRGASATVSTAVAFGAQDTNVTGWSVTSTSDPGIDAGDKVACWLAASDAVNFSSTSISTPGVTYASPEWAERCDQPTTDGNDVCLFGNDWAVNSGASTGNTTFGCTAASATSGPVAYVRLHDGALGTTFYQALTVTFRRPGVSE
jgi:hypothetical protein